MRLIRRALYGEISGVRSSRDVYVTAAIEAHSERRFAVGSAQVCQKLDGPIGGKLANERIALMITGYVYSLSAKFANDVDCVRGTVQRRRIAVPEDTETVVSVVNEADGRVGSAYP